MPEMGVKILISNLAFNHGSCKNNNKIHKFHATKKHEMKMEMEMEKRLHNMKKVMAVMVILLIGGLSSFPVFAAPTLQQCDINGDGLINLSDFVEMNQHMGQTGTPGWIKEDVDKNGIIQVCDMMFVANHYGASVNPTDNARIKKLSIAYSSAMNNEDNQEFIANHFDMVDCPRTYPTAVSHIKSINPNIKVLGYYDSMIQGSNYADWNYVNQHESWFLHDVNGNRVRSSIVPTNYIMNPSSGWSSYYASQCQQFLNNNPQYDGIFSDDVITDLQEIGIPFTVAYSKIPSSVFTNWGSWMNQHIKNIKTAIGNHMLMPNAWKYTTYCQSTTHIHFWEGFIHHWDKAYNDNHYSIDMIHYAIEQLHTQAELGNIIATNSGCANADSHPTEAKRWALFSYACLAFATVDVTKAYFSWNFYMDDNSHGYYSEMDIALGQPRGDYYRVSGTSYVYAREFSNYYVAANLNLLGTGSVTFTINGVTKTLAPRSAVFIQK